MFHLLRFLLFPFSLLYGLVLELRNYLYDLGWLSSYQSKIKTIAIGNLSTGGTGKTPFIELLIRQLQRNHKIAVISRGYGRSTEGFLWVNESSNALETGDEPLQIKQKFPGSVVAVCEKRVDAIKIIEKECPEINLILLDDAYQHRSVRAHVYILLTTFDNPFWRDYVLPMGRLREWRKGFKRSDFVVVTKCREEFSQFDRNNVQKEMRVGPLQMVYFAREKYNKTYNLFENKNSDLKIEAALLVSGIADNRFILNHIGRIFETVQSFKLSDHIVYNKSLVNSIRQRYLDMNELFTTCIIITEKDAVKLIDFKDELFDLNVRVLPYEHEIWDADVFISQLEDKIKH